jgi:hypothetical protein
MDYVCGNINVIEENTTDRTELYKAYAVEKSSIARYKGQGHLLYYRCQCLLLI